MGSGVFLPLVRFNRVPFTFHITLLYSGQCCSFWTLLCLVLNTVLLQFVHHAPSIWTPSFFTLDIALLQSVHHSFEVCSTALLPCGDCSLSSYTPVSFTLHTVQKVLNGADLFPLYSLYQSHASAVLKVCIKDQTQSEDLACGTEL